MDTAVTQAKAMSQALALYHHLGTTDIITDPVVAPDLGTDKGCKEQL